MSDDSLYQACIFDLDGVIVDTAKYHFLAWQKLARSLQYEFTPGDNEALKGVSRKASLEHILSLAGETKTLAEKERLCDQKNQWYLDYIHSMSEAELLPGVTSLLKQLKKEGTKVALGSASKNARLVLSILDLTSLFDAVVDGNDVEKAKPHPEVFLRAAKALNCPRSSCIVFEDAPKGIEAAKAAHMMAIGIGSPESLVGADVILPDFQDFTSKELMTLYKKYIGSQ